MIPKFIGMSRGRWYEEIFVNKDFSDFILHDSLARERKAFCRVGRTFLGELAVPLLEGLWTQQAPVCIQVQAAERKCARK